MKKFIKLPSLSRVSPGNTATLELPLGPTYERIVFDLTGTGLTVAHINRIRVMIDGKEKQTFKNLQRLIDLNSYWNRDADSANQFALHFNRAELVDGIQRAMPGIGTADLQTFYIEMDIDATAPANITIKATAQTDPTRQPIGAFYEIREFPFASAVAGQVEQDKLPRGAFYSAIHLFKSDISAVEVSANDVKLLDATKTTLERMQKASSPKARVPLTAKATHIDFMTEGSLFDSIPTAGLSDWRIKMTLDSVGSVDIVTETINTL